jgi:hypothetical protein
MSETPSGPTALSAFNAGFAPSASPILPDFGPIPWTHPLISFKIDPINSDLDMLPTGKFTIHTHPTFHVATILCTPDGPAITTLSAPRTRHLFQLFRPDLTRRTFKEEVYQLITILDSRSEIGHLHAPPPHATEGPLVRTSSQPSGAPSTSKHNSTQTPSTNHCSDTPTTHSTPKT